MAGTPTTNYNIPTYADTDAPDLSGAYNDAMGIIDTQLKANADATAAKQDKLTAGDGILINEDKISARGAYTISSDTIETVESTGLPAEHAGTVTAACSEAALVDRIVAVNDAQHMWPGGAVPTVQVLKNYVESKIAAAEAAYTGRAPITVDNGEHAIGITRATLLNETNVDGFMADSANTAFTGYCPAVANSIGAIDKLKTGTEEQGYPQGRTVPSVFAMTTYVDTRTPDASLTEKGLVKLAQRYISGDTGTAATGNAITDAFTQFLNNWPDIATKATTPLTTKMLANLYVTPSGMVVYKAPSE